MKSTMPSPPLSVTAILRHGIEVHSDQTVTTATPAGYREITYSALGGRVAQLAHGLASIGAGPDWRIATFMRNNQEHLEAYFAIPCMGAVLHTLNIRLAPQQVSGIANHAVSCELMRTFKERYGVAVRQMWGMTETSPMAAAASRPLNTSDSEALAIAEHRGPVGVRRRSAHRG
jgi:acyl-CoA synthetase (AMP-forming)/AMP-acid ligase II